MDLPVCLYIGYWDISGLHDSLLSHDAGQDPTGNFLMRLDLNLLGSGYRT
jgi:hypothetical protein